MAQHEWVREQPDGALEFCTTEVRLGHDPQRPAGDGWRRNYSMGIGPVADAGESPARSIKGRS